MVLQVYLNWQELVLTYMPVWFLQEDSNQHIVMEKKLSTETRGSLKLFNNRAKIPIIIHPLVYKTNRCNHAVYTFDKTCNYNPCFTNSTGVWYFLNLTVQLIKLICEMIKLSVSVVSSSSCKPET